MIDARRLYDACFHAAVAVSQTFIAVVAGVAVARCGPERSSAGAKSCLRLEELAAVAWIQCQE